MLGAAKTDALCAETNRYLCLCGRVCIGADLELPEGIRPFHYGCKITGKLCRNSLNSFRIYLARASVKAHPISLFEN